ncbi:MAG: HAD family hydrolase [Patescibacteria group bacterium]
MLQKYRHISFDLDGTLVHTVPEYRYAIIPKIIERLGGKQPTQRMIDRFWFESTRNTIIENEFKLDPISFWTVYQQHDLAAERDRHTHAYDDAEPVITMLKQMGKVVSIITGAPERIAKMEIAKLKSAPIDLYCSTTSHGFPEKPNPESFHFVLRKLDMAPEETLYIGNSNEDAYFAKNAGVDFIYLERKQHEFDEKEWMVATVHSLHDILQGDA